MLTFYLNKENKTPLYEQLYDEIKKSIIENELLENEKLPSKRKLAQHLKVSVMTVENAYGQLVAEGYIKSVAKKGFFVLPFMKHIPIKSKHQNALFKVDTPKTYEIDFKTNLVDRETFPYDRIAKIEKEIMQYDYEKVINQKTHLGLYELRVQISKLLFQYRGMITKPESIVVGSGSENLISLIVMLLGRDKTYGVEEPGYLKNYKLYKDYGATSKTFYIDQEGPRLDTLKGIDVVHMTPSHQFPLGIVTSIARRMALLHWASSDESRYIIEDDYDSEFRFSGKPIPALKSLDDHDRVIYLNSFSKSISPTLRISFMVLPDQLMNKFNQEFSYLNCFVPLYTQLMLKKFIEDGLYEKHLAKMKTTYRIKRDFLIDQFVRSSFSQKISIKGEDSGLHFIIEMNTKESIGTIIEKAKAVNVRVYGINEYFLSSKEQFDYKTLVIGYGHLSQDQMMEALKRLEVAWYKL